MGKLLAGRYHLVRLLGDGGMGAVYKAADQVLRRFVAIKLLHPAVRENRSSVERFEREARAAAAIGHPNIIDILDFGREEGRPYMVMEYLRGRSLSQVIAMDARLPVKRATTIAIHTLAGLSAAHDRGILHRDLKPANLMLVVRFGDRNFVKVCDFGFAALLGGDRSEALESLTPERTLVGTPAYAAPERLRGDVRRDPRLDVYSVGVVLYEMLAGHRPFDAPTFRELARKVRTETPPTLRYARPDLPAGLEDVVMRALAKDRDERWASAEAFGEALFPFAGMQVPFREESPTDSFTMEMMRIKAREARLREAQVPAAIVDAASTMSRRELEREFPSLANESLADNPDLTELMSDEEALEVQRASQRFAAERAAKERASTFGASSSLELPIIVDPPISIRQVPRADPGQCSGRIVVPILRFVALQFGERALKVVLDSMPPGAREPFALGIDATSWVSLTAVGTLVEHIDAQLGQDDMHLVLEAGRAAAEGVFELIEARCTATPLPELVIAELPVVLGQVLRDLDCEVRRVGRGHGRLELLDRRAPSLTLAVSVLGLISHSLEHFGATDVEANLLSARALDDPQTLIDVSWLA